MKTAGDLLREKRLLKELSLDTVATKTKIKIEYLQAIENSDFTSLPSSTFAKGFLRNYASFLLLNPDTIVAMFRRDFTQNIRGEIIPRGLVEPVSSSQRNMFSVNFILTTIATVVFLGFLGFQLITWWSLPKLTILQPKEGDSYGEKVTIKGMASKDDTISVNGQLVIIDSSGQFSIDLIFPSGTHTIQVEAKNRQNKSSIVERTFSVSK